MARGPLIILSGPSGSGKSTVIRRLLTEFPDRLRLSVSATTRPRRKNEQEGVHYWFWPRERFLDEVARGNFLESATVHGNLYGTPKSEVEPYRDQGQGVILDIDVQGAASVRALYPDHVSVFLKTSAPDVLEKRLRERGTEGETAIQTRLANARKEFEQADTFQYQVINDDLDTAVARLRQIVGDAFEERTGSCSTN